MKLLLTELYKGFDDHSHGLLLADAEGIESSCNAGSSWFEGVSMSLEVSVFPFGLPVCIGG